MSLTAANVGGIGPQHNYFHNKASADTAAKAEPWLKVIKITNPDTKHSGYSVWIDTDLQKAEMAKRAAALKPAPMAPVGVCLESSGKVSDTCYAELTQGNEAEVEDFAKKYFSGKALRGGAEAFVKKKGKQFAAELNSMTPANRKKVLDFLTKETSDIKLNSLKLYLVKDTVLPAIAEGHITSDRTTQKALRSMVKVVEGKVKPELAKGFHDEMSAKRQVIGDLLTVLSKQPAMSQKGDNCGIVSIHAVLAKDPERYIKMATDLLLHGKTKLPDGSMLTLPKNPSSSPDGGPTNLFIILDGALNKLQEGEDYDYGEKGSVPVSASDMADLTKKLIGKDFVVTGDNAGNLDSIGWGSNDTAAYNALLRAKSSGSLPAYAGVMFESFHIKQKGTTHTGATEAPTVEALHVIVVEDIDTSKNPPVFILRDLGDNEPPKTIKMNGDDFLEVATWSAVDKKASTFFLFAGVILFNSAANCFPFFLTKASAPPLSAFPEKYFLAKSSTSASLPCVSSA